MLKFSCNICQKVISRPDNLKRHMLLLHSSVKSPKSPVRKPRPEATSTAVSSSTLLDDLAKPPRHDHPTAPAPLQVNTQPLLDPFFSPVIDPLILSEDTQLLSATLTPTAGSHLAPMDDLSQLQLQVDSHHTHVATPSPLPIVPLVSQISTIPMAWSTEQPQMSGLETLSALLPPYPLINRIIWVPFPSCPFYNNSYYGFPTVMPDMRSMQPWLQQDLTTYSPC
ncbi:hypothetical protein BC829DRAFT_389882 [Chytridium lagenaria]|nr:hypothetical protein BC829DRAFT_389882 [Chytridium lagenaria]